MTKAQAKALYDEGVRVAARCVSARELLDRGRYVYGARRAPRSCLAVQSKARRDAARPQRQQEIAA